LLRNIELATKQRIEIAAVPTVVDVRARRLDLMRAALAELIAAGDLEGYRLVVEALSDEFDLMDIATAAVKLAHTATGGDEKQDADLPILQAQPAPPKRPRTKGDRAGIGAARPVAGMVRIYVGAGRKANMRPADLVGAITNEAKIEGRQIGAIEIADRFSLVELPEDLVDPVIAALRATTVKGKRLTVRRDKAGGRPARA
jgi:ATP-dependent RNA helicase DeaD